LSIAPQTIFFAAEIDMPATAPGNSPGKSLADRAPGKSRRPAPARAPETQPWPADKIERWAVAKLIPYARNARKHVPRKSPRLPARSPNGAGPRPC
jgi:hypothetical protein